MLSRKKDGYVCKIIRIIAPKSQVSALDDTGLVAISQSHLLAVDNSTLRVFDRVKYKPLTELGYNLSSSAKDTKTTNKKNAPVCTPFDKGIRIAVKLEENAKKKYKL